MIVFRIIGWLILAFAAMNFGAAVLSYMDLGTWKPISTGQLWFNISPDTLNLSQAVIQRYVHPSVWDPIIIWILSQSAWLVLTIISVTILTIFRKGAFTKKNNLMFSKN